MQNQQTFGLENFRVIKERFDFDLAPLTVLTGTNSSGKSTLMSAFQLLKENFNDYKKEEETYKNIDDIFDKDIDVHTLLRRYGKLDQFLSRGSKEDAFSFSFRIPMIDLEDEMEVSCKVQIKDNVIKTGRIVSLLAHSHKSGEEILHIYKAQQIEKMQAAAKDLQGADFRESPIPGVRDFYNVITLNLSFFVKYFQKMVDEKAFYYSVFEEVREEGQKLANGEISKDELDKYLNDTNKKYGFGFKIEERNDKERRYWIIRSKYQLENQFKETWGWNRKSNIDTYQKELIEYKGIYNFSGLFKDDKDFQDRFASILYSHYKLTFDESLEKFQKDVIKFLSSIEWTQIHPTIDWMGPSLVEVLSKIDKSERGLSFRRFLNLYTNLREDFLEGEKTPVNVIIKEYFVKSAIDKNPNFYYEVFVPFLELIRELCTTKVVNREEKVYLLNLPENIVQITESEKAVYDSIYRCIDAIPSWFYSLKEVDILPSVRITPKRVYSLDDTDVFTRLIRLYYTDKRDKDKQLNAFIDKWLKEFGLGDAFKIVHDPDTGNFKPYLIKGASDTLLADFGYGTLQILPLIFIIASKYDVEEALTSDTRSGYVPRFIIIEEPEANLHPELQSKLADMFTEAAKKFNLQLIVETHSEYFIRKLQYLTAKGKISKDLTNIYYFHLPQEKTNNKQIQKINIRQDGSLDHDFGSGFFDEADNIATDIWDLVYSKKN